jgi:hypothetical protein
VTLQGEGRIALPRTPSLPGVQIAAVAVASSSLNSSVEM